MFNKNDQQFIIIYFAKVQMNMTNFDGFNGFKYFGVLGVSGSIQNPNRFEPATNPKIIDTFREIGAYNNEKKR